jgi:hypothetical protein
MISIQINPEQLNHVISALSGIVGGAPFAVNEAIRYTLRKVRTRAGQAATERYNISSRWVTGQARNPIVGGMSGTMIIAGARAPLQLFPHSSVFPGGVEVQELRGHAMTVRHAFITPSGGVMTRGAAGAPRYPIHPMVGVSAPEMVGESTQVWPGVEAFMEETMMQRLEHNIAAIMSGAIAL